MSEQEMKEIKELIELAQAQGLTPGEFLKQEAQKLLNKG
jgi:hypothetical protein